METFGLKWVTRWSWHEEWAAKDASWSPGRRETPSPSQNTIKLALELLIPQTSSWSRTCNCFLVVCITPCVIIQSAWEQSR